MIKAMADGNQMFQAAMALHQRGNFVEAARIYRRLIKTNPDNRHALHYLGAIEVATGNLARGKSLMARSLEVDPQNLVFIENYATVLCQIGEFDVALQLCERGLRLNPASAVLLFNGALALHRTDHLEEALRQLDKLLQRHAKHIAALNERGAVLAAMKKHQAALDSFDRALAVDPAFVDAHINKGTVYWQLERHDEAAASYDRAISLNPRVAVAWLGVGNVKAAFKRHGKAFEAYDKAIAIDPALAEAWLARGNLSFSLTSYEEAAAAYDKALAINPNLADAWLGQGNLLFNLRRYDDALRAYEKARSLRPEFAEAWFGCGNVKEGLKRYGDALTDFDRAISLKPDQAGWESARLRVKMQLCDWCDLDAYCANLLSASRTGKLHAFPLELLSLPSSSEDQLQCATHWIAKQYPAADTPTWHGERYSHERIRLAYISADFKPHPVALLTAGMFEHHDKSRFEVTGISLGPGGDWEIRRRLQAAFDHFIDAGHQSDRRIAEMIREREIDILVDLNGLTGGGRPGIFAQRCAPVQASYLGYPGTSGAAYMNYIIADRIVIPDDRKACYSEKVVHLPNTFLVNDARLTISDAPVNRSDAGLPSNGFVFCCFNNSYKITPHLFDCWMRVLRAVEGSVLWLANDNAEATNNMRREAAARGVAPERLIFADRLPLLADHLARLRMADLFLDTLPYNAHATASHALWAGVPVLTCLGETFAGRVGASLLQAIRLPELITTTADAYEALAIELARFPAKLLEIKARLAANRLAAPLFDTRRFTASIEAAFVAMHARHLGGLPPGHIDVPPP